MWNARLVEVQAGIKIAGRNINNLRYGDNTTLMAESKELKNFLMKVKEESEKVDIKLNIHKTKIMASGPITSWQIGKQWKQWKNLFPNLIIMTTFKQVRSIFLGSKITVDGECSHEIKRCFLLGRKALRKLDSILKSRDIILLTKDYIVKVMVFPVIMYRCESWTIRRLSTEELMFSNCGSGEDS